jgi:hypothetical protein
MTAEPLRADDPRIEHALDELRGVIVEKYPSAIFEVSHGVDDPRAVHLTATIDVDDTDEVVDLVIDRMIEMQIEEELPIFVIPVRPVERSWEIYVAQKAEREHRAGRKVNGS